MNKIFLTCLSLILLTSCQRPQESGGASVSIQIPTVQQFAASMKNQSSSGTPVDYARLCFAVNVKGTGIQSTPSSSCDIERGQMEGTVKPGDVLTMSILAGDNREFEVFGFLRNSTTEPCPSLIGSPWGGHSLRKIYSLGKKTGVTIVAPESKVDITISLPLDSQNIAVLNGWDTSCTGPTTTASRFGDIVLGAKDLSSASYQLRARVATQKEIVELTGTNGSTFKGGVR